MWRGMTYMFVASGLREHAHAASYFLTVYGKEIPTIFHRSVPLMFN